MSSYKLGTAVALKNNLHGTIKYIGKMRGRKGIWYGIKLTSAHGDNDGMDSGRYYFVCKEKYGIFVKKKQIRSMISNTRSARQSQKMAKLREKNITLFDVTSLIPNDSENKDDDKEEDKEDEKYESKIDYESSIIHQFFRFSLSTLILYLDNNTLYNLFGIEHFTSFYDIASFWNANMLIDRIINGNTSLYRQVQLNGVHINIWNVEGAFNGLKQHKLIQKHKWKVRRYRFLVFTGIQHIKSHAVQYDFSRVQYNGYHGGLKKRITKANCHVLKEEYVKVYGDLSVVSSDLISVNYGGDEYRHSALSGSVKKFKEFKSIFDGNRNISLFRKRDGVNGIIAKLEKILIIPITDLLIKQWIIFNTSRHTIICGWISPKCIIVIFGGCRPSHGWW